jgi:hypothetical protein
VHDNKRRYEALGGGEGSWVFEGPQLAIKSRELAATVGERVNLIKPPGKAGAALVVQLPYDKEEGYMEGHRRHVKRDKFAQPSPYRANFEFREQNEYNDP